MTAAPDPTPQPEPDALSGPSTAGRIIQSELTLLRRFRMLRLALLAFALVPAVYALIYLSSVWDPNAKTSALPVAIVNLDTGIHYKGQAVNVGEELTQGLMGTGTFGFRPMPDGDAARQAVRLGDLAFAVIIPADFSANAVPGVQPGAGKVTVIFSEGNNYASAGFARRFAEELGHQVNETLNEKRWQQVLVSVDGSGKNLAKLKLGITQLRAGAETLDDSVSKYSGAATQLSNGFKQVGAGLRGMEAKMPPEADLKALRAGTQRVSAGHRELGQGLEQLQLGAGKLAESASQMQTRAAEIPTYGEQIAKVAGEFAAGGTQLKDGLTTAIDGNARLTRGSARIETNTGKLIDGATTLSESLHTLVSKLPDDARLDTFNSSGKALAEGAARLRSGIDLVDSVLPATPGKLDGSARGLADSVEPTLEVLAPVANNGSAFAPNMVAMALWLGAVMSTYLFNMRTLLAEHASASMVAKALGKFSLPALLVLVQAFLTFLMLVFGLGVQAPNYATFAATMVVASLAFLAMVYLLLRVFGEAGKLIAVLLLTLQLAAGGGVMPIELTGDFFRAVHSWLPFTWVVKAFRASLFGAFDNGWLHAWSMVAAIGGVCLVLASVLGRWKVVSQADYRPAIES
jgi:putative membrane protein